MSDKLVTLAIRTYQRAQMIKTVLEEHGIETIIHNLNLEHPEMAVGVRVRIKEKDLPQALAIVEQIEKEWEKENGKTLVVFPMHSTDDSTLSYSEKEYIKKIKKIATGYDTVLICMFWWNLDMPIVKAFKQEGFKIASAGYREDPMFLRRQRTMIEMADCVVTDAIGTHVGYCYKLGKSVEMINSGTKTNIYNDTFIKQQVKNIENAILSGDRNLIDSTMKFYWGNDISYSKEKLKNIAEINEEITIRGHYWVKNYPKAARQLLEKYRESDEIKYSLLKRAMQ